MAAWFSRKYGSGRHFKKDGVSGEWIKAPVTGRAAELSEVADDVFAKEVLGKGAAIFPEEGRVYAPGSGEITIFLRQDMP